MDEDLYALLDQADPETLNLMLQALSSGETMGVGHGLMSTPQPEGRNVGHTYVASSPLEHMSAAANRGLGSLMMQGGQGQRATGIQAYIDALRGKQPQFDPQMEAAYSGFNDPNNYG